MYGKINEEKEDEPPVFDWSHSYSRVIHPSAPYDHRGIFLFFHTYSVETRDRLKCISGVEGT